MRQLKITNKITSRESYALEKYLSDIGKIPLISTDEEMELARRIKRGDDRALEVMTRANLRFVVSVAKQYQNQGLTLADLINEGNIGLIKAAKRYDETKGFKFISYAVWWIRQSILQSIVEHSRIVRVPNNRSSSYNKVNDSYISFIQRFEREPTYEELAEEMGLSERDIADVLNNNSRHVSIDSPLKSDDSDSGSMLDFMISEEDEQPDHRCLKESLSEEIRHSIQQLSYREAQVVNAFYGIQMKPLSLEEIADRYSLSRERVRQIKDRALLRLRRSQNREEMLTYLA